MNRQMRRKNKRLAASLGGLSEAAEKLQPYLALIEQLRVELANAAQLLNRTRAECVALAETLDAHQNLYFRLFAQGMGVSLDTVLSMANQIQAQLEGERHGITNPRTTAPEEPADDSGS